MLFDNQFGPCETSAAAFGSPFSSRCRSLGFGSQITAANGVPVPAKWLGALEGALYLADCFHFRTSTLLSSSARGRLHILTSSNRLFRLGEDPAVETC